MRGVVLLLHGGRAKSHGPVTARQLAVLRMGPFASHLRRTGAPHGLAVARLRHAVRGWNGEERSPVADGFWALDQLAERFPGLPVTTVGHSMGGRTAFYVAGHPSVEAVVGLAPWLERGDPVDQLAGRRVLIAHGAMDRMTSAKASARFAEQAAAIATSVSYVRINAEGHAMLRRAAIWHELTTGFVLGVMFGWSPEGTGSPRVANVLTQALAGQASLVV